MPHFTGYKIVEGWGNWGVDLFFVLSGYLLAEFFWRPRARGLVGSFYVRRIFRIAPAYYANIAILFIFFAPHAALFSAQGVKQVAANLTFTQYLFPNTASSLNVNGALWTLTIEMLLYLFMPLMAWLMYKRPYAAFVGMVSVGLAYLTYIAFSASWLKDLFFGSSGAAPDEANIRLYLARQFPGQLPLFALGMFLRWLIVNDKIPRRFAPQRRRPSVLLLVLLLVPSNLLLFGVERASFYTHPGWFILFNFVLGLLFIPPLLYASAPGTREIGRPAKVGVWFGQRSYGIYLWHFALILSIYGRGAMVNPPPTTWMLLRVALAVALAVLFGAISFSCLEEPARKYGRALSGRVRRPPRSRGPEPMTAMTTEKVAP